MSSQRKTRATTTAAAVASPTPKPKADLEKVVDQTQILSPPVKVSGRSLRSPSSTPVKKDKDIKMKSRPLLDDFGDEEKTAEVTDEKQDVQSTSNQSKAKSPFHTSSTEIISCVQKAYKIVQKSTGALGGNGYDGAIYGELTMHSMQKIIDFLVDTCDMDTNSCFIDVGSGLGKPNFHAAQDPGVRLSLGIELEEIRWKLAMHNLDNFMQELVRSSSTTTPTAIPTENSTSNQNVDSSENTTIDSTSSSMLKGGVNFICGDINDASTLDPFTHVYMYDLGFPPDLQRSIALKFNNSVHCRYLISYRPAHRVAGEEYGYNVELIGQMPTHMHGSGEVHTAYFYKRLPTPPPPSLLADNLPDDAVIITLPARSRIAGDTELSVACASVFKNAIELAVGPIAALAAHANALSQAHLAEGRPTRTRKPRVLAI
eukprot:gene12339-25963_t